MRYLLAVSLTLALACSLAAAAADFAWGPDLPYRVPVVVKTAGVEETDAPVQVRLNFTTLLPEGELLDPGSVRVVEQDSQTGAVLRECPALLQPVDGIFRGVAPINHQRPYDPEKPPWIRASSENPEHAAQNLIERTDYWEAGSTTPPWTVAVDLGEARLISAVLVGSPFHGAGQVIGRARLEVATESEDGLTDGNWEPVGSWEVGDQWGNGYRRPFFFAPRQVRYVRLVIEGLTSVMQPRLNAFEIYRPLYDPATRQDCRLSWYVPGKWQGERTFFVYYDSQRNGTRPSQPLPPEVAVLREAEETAPVGSPAGVGFGPTYDKTASGPSDPNLLSFQWQGDQFVAPTAWAVTLPTDGQYTIAFRARGNPGDHALTVLWDRKTLFSGSFGLEGDDWNMIGLQPLALTAGVHTLELMMKKGTGPRPLDLDLVMLTTAPQFLPHQVLLAYPGPGEARP